MLLSLSQCSRVGVSVRPYQEGLMGGVVDHCDCDHSHDLPVDNGTS